MEKMQDNSNIEDDRKVWLTIELAERQTLLETHNTISVQGLVCVVFDGRELSVSLDWDNDFFFKEFRKTGWIRVIRASDRHIVDSRFWAPELPRRHFAWSNTGKILEGYVWPDVRNFAHFIKEK